MSKAGRGYKARNGPLAHGIAVQLALAMLSTGKAKTKAEAAALAGIQPVNLTPQRLKAFAASNPVGKQLASVQPNYNLLDITTDVGGKRVSAREAFASGVERSIAVIERHGKRIGKLTKAQRAHMLDAKRFLDMARLHGMFTPAAPAPSLPDELANPPDSAPSDESIPGSLSDFVDEDDSSIGDQATT